MDTRVGALTGLHVLVVDNNRDSRTILSAMLRYFGAFVTAVPAAKTALRSLRQIAPDVVVAELKLPDRDATWLVRQARKIPVTAPFIGVSAIDFDARRLQAQGFEACLPKPIEHVKLVDAILAITRRR